MATRRRLLRDLAPGLVLAGAGCTGDADDTPTGTPSPTRRPGPAPTSRVLGRRATAADGTRVTARRWTSFASVTYQGEDGLSTVEPRRGRFVAYDFTVGNAGEERLSSVSDSVFRLQLAGGSYRHVHTLRGVPFDAVRQSGAARVRPLSWFQSLSPDESVRLQFVFDVLHRPRLRHYLAWDHPEPVGGVEGSVVLWPTGE